VLAVDGGNSKLDAVLLSRGGRVLGAARGGGASFAPDDHER
jgi:N-acetylglucosamine kinase-like BadF-type ATPase